MMTDYEMLMVMIAILMLVIAAIGIVLEIIRRSGKN